MATQIESGFLVDGTSLVVLPGNILSAPFQGVSNLRQGGNVPGISADGTTGADSHLAEYFYADMRCNASTIPVGFDAGGGQNGSAGKLFPATSGTPYWGTRQITYSGGLDQQANQLTLTARLLLNAGNNSPAGSFVGFDSGPAKAQNTAPNNSIGFGINAQGFYFLNQGTVTLVLPIAGASAGAPGYLDSGAGQGWGPPANGFYDVTMFYPGDGTATISICQFGTVYGSYSFYLGGQTLPAGGIKNLSYSGVNSNDQVANISYAALGGGANPHEYLVPHQPGRYNPMILTRFPVANNCFLWISPSYVPGGDNPLIVLWHGYSASAQVVQNAGNGANYGTTTRALLQAGYSILSIQGTINDPYGCAQGVADYVAAIAKVQAAFSYAAQVIPMADSAGAFNALNAVMQGAINAYAGVLFCPSTNLALDFLPFANSGATGGGATAPITAAYSITSSNPYAVATAGYDPLLAETDGNPQHIKNLANVPWLIFASPNDQTVNKAQNADLLDAMLKRNGGISQVVVTSGGHEDASNFTQPATITAFLAGPARKGASTYSPFTPLVITVNKTVAAGESRRNYTNNTANPLFVTPLPGNGPFAITSGSTGATSLALSPENLVLNALAMEGSQWGMNALSVTATNAADPFSGTQGRTILVGSGSGGNYIYPIGSTTGTAGAPYVLTIWVQGIGASIGRSIVLNNYNNGARQIVSAVLTANWQLVTVYATGGNLSWGVDVQNTFGGTLLPGQSFNMYGASMYAGHQKAFVATTGTVVTGAYDVIGPLVAAPTLFVTESNGVFQTSTTYP